MMVIMKVSMKKKLIKLYIMQNINNIFVSKIAHSLSKPFQKFRSQRALKIYITSVTAAYFYNFHSFHVSLP